MREIYAFEARSQTGAFVAGTLAAVSRAEAIDSLHARTLAVTTLTRADSPRGVLASLRIATSRAGTARIALFRSVATLVSAGVALRRALEIAGEQCDSQRFRSAIAGVGAELERGALLSEALQLHPREFPDVVCALMRAGETSGTLDDALERVAELLERGHALRRSVSSALVYPAIVGMLACGLVAFLVAAVVPEMASMLRGFDVQLPLATRALLALASALRDPFTICTVIGVVCAASVGAAAVARTTHGQVWLDRIRFGVPIVGPIARRAEVAACIRTLGTTLRCGVPLSSALRSSAGMTRSARLRGVFESVGEAVGLGQRVAPSFAASPLIDPLVVGLVRAGEESGALDAMLVRAAEHLEAEVAASTATLAAVVEPALILVLGCIIAAIVAAVLVPLYSTIGSIS